MAALLVKSNTSPTRINIPAWRPCNELWEGWTASNLLTMMTCSNEALVASSGGLDVNVPVISQSTVF